MPRAKRRAFKIVFSYRTVVTPVDIPEDWDPRANQSPTGALITSLRAAALFEPTGHPTKKKKSAVLNSGR